MSLHDPSDPRPDPPVVLVHGWGGSFAETWERSGFTMLLADAGRQVVGVDLLGHGTAPKPHDPDAYADLGRRVIDSITEQTGSPDTVVDAIGFSLGALTLLRVALAEPGRFRRLVLAGVGRNVFERDDAAVAEIVAAIEGGSDAADDGARNRARLFAQYAHRPGNDPIALAALMRRRPSAPLSPSDLSSVACPVLVAIGEHDDAGPADVLVDALPDARVQVLRRTDHFATPEAFEFIDATLEFLDAVPS